jgi:hypothetical protein
VLSEEAVDGGLQVDDRAEDAAFQRSLWPGDLRTGAPAMPPNGTKVSRSPTRGNSCRVVGTPSVGIVFAFQARNHALGQRRCAACALASIRGYRIRYARDDHWEAIIYAPCRALADCVLANRAWGEAELLRRAAALIDTKLAQVENGQ